jgi:hypothetical protein
MRDRSLKRTLWMCPCTSFLMMMMNRCAYHSRILDPSNFPVFSSVPKGRGQAAIPSSANRERYVLVESIETFSSLASLDKRPRANSPSDRGRTMPPRLKLRFSRRSRNPWLDRFRPTSCQTARKHLNPPLLYSARPPLRPMTRIHLSHFRSQKRTK